MDVQEKTAQVVNLAAKVVRAVVDNPHVVVVLDRGDGEVEFHGRQPGEAVVIVWTQKARFVFLVSVKPAPPPPRTTE